MPTIKPFDGYLIKQSRANTVVSPAYDSVSIEQRRKFAEENPENFINTMRMQEDFPDDAKPSQTQLLNGNKDKLHALIDDGSFRPIEMPCMFVYQLGHDDQLQTGLAIRVCSRRHFSDCDSEWCCRHRRPGVRDCHPREFLRWFDGHILGNISKVLLPLCNRNNTRIAMVTIALFTGV